MNISTKILELCIDISRYENFTKVANMHYISQQALSQQIKKLEDDLGIQIFKRNNRSVKTTPAGKAFIAEAEIGLNHIYSAIHAARNFSQTHNSVLAVGCNGPSSRMHLINAIERFSLNFPEININVKNASYDEIIDNFKKQAIYDLIIVGDFEQFDPSVFNIRQCKSGNIAAMFSKKHPLAMKKEVTPEDLLKEQLICLTFKSAPDVIEKRMQRFEKLLGKVPDKIKYAEDTDTIDMLVASCLGYTFLNSALQKDTKYQDFVFLPIRGVSMVHPTWIVWRKDNTNPALEKFLDLSRDITV